MAASRLARLRVGVIGLGRLWETRHKPALVRLRDRFQVTAVYDQVLRRAELEAAQLGCAAVAGLTALIDRSDVDVVYLLTPQWFGLHPVEVACARRKPIYCALPLSGEPRELESIAQLITESGVPFVPEFARRFYPATLRLRELLATTLGPPRLILGQNRLYGFDRYGQPGPTVQIAPAPLMIDPGSYLFDWCCFLFGSPPVAVQGWAGRSWRRRGRGRTSKASSPSSREEARLRSPSAGITATPGATRTASCRRRASRSSRNEGRPGSNCPTASSGLTPRRARGTASPGAKRRRGPERPVPPARPRRTVPGADHRGRLGRCPGYQRPAAEPDRGADGQGLAASWHARARPRR